jgi:hypothetical protein
LSSDDDFVLVKQVFEFAPVGLPPCALQWINQNLDGNYVIALHRAAAVPKALGRCSVYAVRPPNVLVSFARTSL